MGGDGYVNAAPEGAAMDFLSLMGEAAPKVAAVRQRVREFPAQVLASNVQRWY